MNCMLWVFYGLPVVHKDSILVTTINGVGLVVELIYIGLFLYYCTDQKHYHKKIGYWIVAEVIGVAAVVLITLFAIQNAFAKQTFVGVVLLDVSILPNLLHLLEKLCFCFTAAANVLDAVFLILDPFLTGMLVFQLLPSTLVVPWQLVHHLVGT